MTLMFAGIEGRECGSRSGPENSAKAPRSIGEGGETPSVSVVRHKEAKKVSTFLAVGMSMLKQLIICWPTSRTRSDDAALRNRDQSLIPNTRNSRTRLASWLGLVAIFFFSLPLALHAQETENSKIGDWLLRCAGAQDSPDRACLIATTATTPIEQRDIAVLQVIRVSALDRQGDEEFAVQLTSPTNVNVRNGIDFSIDQDFIQNVSYEVCTINNCITSFALSSEAITLMRNGFAASLIFTDASGQFFSGVLSLDGFGPALDQI